MTSLVELYRCKEKHPFSPLFVGFEGAFLIFFKKPRGISFKKWPFLAFSFPSNKKSQLEQADFFNYNSVDFTQFFFLLVVISTTPFFAFEPYLFRAASPFMTFIVAIFLGDSFFTCLLEASLPSMI